MFEATHQLCISFMLSDVKFCLYVKNDPFWIIQKQ